MVACDNLKCKQVVQLEPDGSPPLFCSGCGSKISLSLFEIEPIIGRDCQNCGKVVMKRLDGAVAIYCSRCGFSTFTIEVCDSIAEDKPDQEIILKPSSRKLRNIYISKAPANTMMLCTPVNNENYLSSVTYEDKFMSEFEKNFASSVQNPETDVTVEMPLELDESCSDKGAVCDEDITTSVDVSSPSQIGNVQPNNTDIGDHSITPRPRRIYKKTRIKNLIRETYQHCCSKCQRRFKTARGLALHTTNVHDALPKFGDVNKIIRSSCGADSQKRYCYVCKIDFKSKSCYEEHVECNSCVEQQFWKCTHDKCDYFSVNRQLFTNHSQTHLPKKFKCHLCSKVVKTTSQLRDHLSAHSGGNSHKCDDCGQSFTYISQYYRHKRNKCQQFCAPRKLCQKCGKTVVDLRLHDRSVHQKIRPFACTFCEKSFYDMGKLTEHIRVHTGEKPYKCSYCDYGSKQRGYLTIHMSKCKFRPSTPQAEDEAPNL